MDVTRARKKLHRSVMLRPLTLLQSQGQYMVLKDFKTTVETTEENARQDLGLSDLLPPVLLRTSTTATSPVVW